MTELVSGSMLHLFAYLKGFGLGDCTGITFVDSTPLRVCHNIRIHQHRVFRGIAQRGQCSIGWFYGLFAALIAYNFNEKKPSLKMNFFDTEQLYLPL